VDLYVGHVYTVHSCCYGLVSDTVSAICKENQVAMLILMSSFYVIQTFHVPILFGKAPIAQFYTVW